MTTNRALFAAGCFWGVQYYFDQIPGVASTVVGYTGGHTEKPTYDAVATQATGHAEAVLVTYNPEKVNYKTLVNHFFRMHDPTQYDRQGYDIGDEYRSAIFYFDQEQHKVAVQVRNKTQEKLGAHIVTEIAPAGPFYKAEEYHQKFSVKTGIGMCHIPYAPIAPDDQK